MRYAAAVETGKAAEDPGICRGLLQISWNPSGHVGGCQNYGPFLGVLIKGDIDIDVDIDTDT